MSTYTITTRRWPALPRSERRRALGAGGGAATYTSAATPEVNSLAADSHTHSNLALLDTLTFDASGYLLQNGNKINAGKADSAANAENAENAKYAENSGKWDGHTFGDYLDQPVRKTDSPTFKGVQSSGFDPSIAALGGGYGIYFDTDGHSNLVIDNIAVRGGMSVVKIYVQEIRAVGGIMVVSQATGKVDRVERYTDSHGRDFFHIYLEDQAGCLQFQVGDLVRCARWRGDCRTDSGTLVNALSYYWVRVNYVNAADGWISAWADEFPSYSVVTPNPDTGGTDIETFRYEPAAGDELVLMGNTEDGSGRDGFLVISSEDGRPRISAYAGVKTASLIGCRRLVLGSLSGVTHSGKALDGYGLWCDNVALRGTFTLDSGDDYNGQDVYDVIKSYFAIADGRIDLAVKKGDLVQAGMTIKEDSIDFVARKLNLLNDAGQPAIRLDNMGNIMMKVARFYDSDLRLRQSINTSGDGFTHNYYDSGRIQSEIGWDGDSFIRVYDDSKLHRLLWKLGNPANIVAVNAAATTDLGQITVNPNGTITHVPDVVGTTYYYRAAYPKQLYKNEAMTQPIDDGTYTREGVAFVSSEIGSNTAILSRTILTFANGAETKRQTARWKYDSATDTYTFLDLTDA